MEQVKQLLDYIASQEDAVITYKASDMVLAAHSDAGYHNEAGARSRAGGHFSYQVMMKYLPTMEVYSM